MINFTQLEIPKQVEQVVERATKGRYVIGLDPFESEAESIKEGSAVNVFVVYDKVVMRVTTRIITKTPFDKMVELFLKNELDKRSYKVSHKFVTKDGRAKTPSEIRAENIIGDKQFKGDIAALQTP